MASERVGVRIEGERELRATMRRAGLDLQDLKDAHAEAASIAEGGVAARAPRVSGALASTIRSSGTTTGGVIRVGRASVAYAGVQNYGWPARHIVGKGFANDGVTDTEPRWIVVYQDAIDRIIDNIKGA